MSIKGTDERYKNAVNMFRNRQYLDAKPIFKELDLEGVLNASRILGNYYLIGLDCKIDFHKAEHYFKKAAVTGDKESLFSLASIYYHLHDFNQAIDILLSLNKKNISPHIISWRNV